MKLKQYALVTAILALCTGVGTVVLPLLSTTDVAVLFLVAVAVVASQADRGPSAFAAFLSIALFDFFFVPPRFTFAVEDLHYVVTFVVMLASPLTISSLAHRLRDYGAAARVREQRTAALYAMSHELLAPQGTAELTQVIARHVGEAFGAHVRVLLRGPGETLAVPTGAPAIPALEDREQSVAGWAFDHWQPAGAGTENFSDAEAIYIPLVAAGGRLGVLGVRPATHAQFADPTMRQVLQTFAGQAASAIEQARARMAEEARAPSAD